MYRYPAGNIHHFIIREIFQYSEQMLLAFNQSLLVCPVNEVNAQSFNKNDFTLSIWFHSIFTVLLKISIQEKDCNRALGRVILCSQLPLCDLQCDQYWVACNETCYSP